MHLYLPSFSILQHFDVYSQNYMSSLNLYVDFPLKRAMLAIQALDTCSKNIAVILRMGNMYMWAFRSKLS